MHGPVPLHHLSKFFCIWQHPKSLTSEILHSHLPCEHTLQAAPQTWGQNSALTACFARTGPFSLPFIGDLPWIVLYGMHEYGVMCQKKYGEVFKVRSSCVLMCDPVSVALHTVETLHPSETYWGSCCYT
jgi:hypothetical protein